jgi:hypothetical protein
VVYYYLVPIKFSLAYRRKPGGRFGSPDNRYFIFTDLWVSGENWQIFHLSLGDQYAIRRILVVNGQR